MTKHLIRKWLLKATTVDKSDRTTTSKHSVFAKTYNKAKANLSERLGDTYSIELIKEET